MDTKPFRLFCRHTLNMSVMLALATGVWLTSASSSSAAFPGTNGKIAFESNRDGNYEIYVMNADGTGVTRLTFNSAFDIEAKWSPDGTKIVFTRDFRIYVMNANGTSQTQLTFGFAGAQEQATSWSPDGAQILFHANQGGPNDIYVMNVDGTGQTRLTFGPGSNAGAVWSPDGSQIAFVSNRDGNAEIYVMNPDGTGQANCTNNLANNGAPAWSPDGFEITFQRGPGGQSEIYVMNANCSLQTNRTNNPADDVHPAWSPDGSQIVFNSDRDGNAESYVMNADGSGQTRRTFNSAADTGPDWGRIPIPICSSTVTTIDGLGAEVDALNTSTTTKNVLHSTLENVQIALDNGNNETARTRMGNFLERVVTRSNVQASNPARLPLDQANQLICSAANVLIGIPLE